MTQSFLTTESSRASGRDRIPASLAHPTLSFRPDREPIRHLLIGSPEIVQRTINHCTISTTPKPTSGVLPSRSPPKKSSSP